MVMCYDFCFLQGCDLKVCTIPLHHPFMMTVCGPSQCGKTRYIMKMIKQNDVLIQPPVDKFIYLYSVEQDSYNDIKKHIRDNSDTSTLKTY